jgi:hypothetical protein
MLRHIKQQEELFLVPPKEFFGSITRIPGSFVEELIKKVST